MCASVCQRRWQLSEIHFYAHQPLRIVRCGKSGRQRQSVAQRQAESASENHHWESVV